MTAPSILPGASLPWNAPEGLHLLDAVPPDSRNPSASPTMQPTRHAESDGTLAISSLKSNCQEKGVSITSVCAFYFGRVAGSPACALVGRVNPRQHNRQTWCAHQSFPDFALTSPPKWRTHPAKRARFHANQLFQPAGRLHGRACAGLDRYDRREARVGSTSRAVMLPSSSNFF